MTQGDKMREGLTLDYAIRKRERLADELHSDEHYNATETVAYGHHDPLSVPVASCEKCGGRGRMEKRSGKKVRWIVVCTDCNQSAKDVRQRPWQAALAWNEVNLGTQDYRDLPLFGLTKVDPETARARMSGIRRNLELRKNLAGIETTIALKTDASPPGRGYHERLDAYLKWAMLALRLIKAADST